MANPNGTPNYNLKHFGFGTRPKEVDIEFRKRTKGVRKRWSKEKCVERISDILDRLDKILLEQEKINEGNPTKLKTEQIRDLNTMMNRLMEFMRYLYPPVQQNVNLNLEMTTDLLMQRLKEGVIIFEVDK
jgi:ribonuclease HII